MKIHVWDRILSGLLAVIMLGVLIATVAQAFFGFPVYEKIIGRMSAMSDFLRVLCLIFVCLVILFFCLYSFSVLFRHKGKKDRTITQETENGNLSITTDALNKLVLKCLNEHPEMSVISTELRSGKKGLCIDVVGNITGGISIPLTVAQIQKHIKQYMTSCTGLDIMEVKVLIRETENDSNVSNFKVDVSSPDLLPETEQEQTENEETELEELVKKHESEVVEKEDQQEESSVFSGYSSAGNMDSDDDRPLHQRIFSQTEEPCIVPCPPETSEDSALAEMNETPEEINGDEINTFTKSETEFEVLDVDSNIEEVKDDAFD